MTGPERTSPSTHDWIALAAVVLLAHAALAMATNAAQFASASSRFGDVDIYRKYAELTRAGGVPYRDFAVEYPPLALPWLLAPAGVARGMTGFRVAFAVEMLACHAGAAALAITRVARGEGASVRARLAWYSVAFALLSRLVVSRYDAAPALLAFAASCALIDGRGATGGWLAATGAFTKIFPALAMPFAPADSGRSRAWPAFAIASVAMMACWLVPGGWRGVADSVGYHAGRGLEYGSVYSGLQMLGAKLVEAPILVGRDHASFSTVTAASGVLSALAVPIQAAGVAGVWGLFVRRGKSEPLRYAAAAILAFASLGKVFSPQYAIWVMPYLAAMDGPAAPRARRLFLLSVALTMAAQGLIGPLPRTGGGVILAYNAKNLAWLSLLAWLAFGPSRRCPGPSDGA